MRVDLRVDSYLCDVGKYITCSRQLSRKHSSLTHATISSICKVVRETVDTREHPESSTCDTMYRPPSSTCGTGSIALSGIRRMSVAIATVTGSRCRRRLSRAKGRGVRVCTSEGGRHAVLGRDRDPVEKLRVGQALLAPNHPIRSPPEAQSPRLHARSVLGRQQHALRGHVVTPSCRHALQKGGGGQGRRMARGAPACTQRAGRGGIRTEELRVKGRVRDPINLTVVFCRFVREGKEIAAEIYNQKTTCRECRAPTSCQTPFVRDNGPLVQRDCMYGLLYTMGYVKKEQMGLTRYDTT
jgi:hypothetical protein